MSFTLYRVTEELKPIISNNSIIAVYTETTDPRLPEHITNTFGRGSVSIGKEHKPTLLTYKDGNLTTLPNGGETPTRIGTLKIVQESHKWYQIYLTHPAPHEHITTPIIQTLIFTSSDPAECEHALTEDYKQRVTNNRLRHWRFDRASLETNGADPTILNHAEHIITQGIWEPGAREKVTNLINEACTAGINEINTQYANVTEELHKKGLI